VRFPLIHHFTVLWLYLLVWYRKDIARQFRRSLRQEGDVHSRLMSVYPEVPDWWYILLGLVSFVIGLIVIEVFNTQVGVLSFVLMLPNNLYLLAARLGLRCISYNSGAICDPKWNHPSRHQSTNDSEVCVLYISIKCVISDILSSVIAEVLGGFLVPGRPVALMLFKTFSYTVLGQALGFTGDLSMLKLHHPIPLLILSLSNRTWTLHEDPTQDDVRHSSRSYDCYLFCCPRSASVAGREHCRLLFTRQSTWGVRSLLSTIGD
jgi:OPT oligopeptide transporter protein